MTTSRKKRGLELSGLIAAPFHSVHRAAREHAYTHYDLSGGRGSGKSSFVSLEVVWLLLQNPNCHAAVFRKVAATIRTSVFAQYEWALGMLGLSEDFDVKVSVAEMVYKPTGQKILFRGADDPAKIKSVKLPFGYIGITHFEEKDQFAGRAEIRSILQSTMRGGGAFWNFESYNPPVSRRNWANADSLEDRPDRLVHKSTYLDVDKAWLGQPFIDEASRLAETNEKAYRHEYLGEVTGDGGAVFENVELRDVTDAEIDAFERVYRGLDFGWFPDPNAFTEVAYDGKRRTIVVFNEIKRNKTGNDEMAKVLEPFKDELITADSAEPKSIADFKARGFRMRGVKKGPGSLDYSMRWLQSLRKIIIDPKRCPAAAAEFLHYAYERDKDGNVAAGYPDADNHFIDSVRYALSGVWSKREE